MSTFPIISLADIVLLLLIYFLLTSTYVISQGIRVKLPKAETKRIQQIENIVVTLTKEGKVFLNQKPIEQKDLTLRIRELLKKSPNAIIVLMADKDVNIQQAVTVLESASKAGGSKLVIATTER